MKFRFIPLLALALCACATQTPYKPAEKRGDYGYTETKLTETRYKVSFRGNASTSADSTRDYVLLRAGELTLEKGYDWFQLAREHTDKKEDHHTFVDPGVYAPPTTHVYQRCGLVGCRTTVVTDPGFSTFGSASTVTSRAYTSEVEIVMGKKPKPSTADAYDAREVVTNLRQTLQPRS